jgi:ribonuclease HI
MTTEIREENKKRRRAERKYKRTPNTENLLEFKKLKATVRRMMRKARKEAWEEFLGSINERTPSQEMWDKIRQLSGKRKTLQIKKLKDSNGRSITNPNEMADLLAKQFAETSSNEHYSQTLKKKEKESRRNRHHH